MRSGGLSLRTYAELGKVRLTMLVVVTTLVGFVLASDGAIAIADLCWTILGTAMAAYGANALNECIEVRADALMRRTCGRPLPAKKLGPYHALAVALCATVAGVVVLWHFANGLTALLAALTVVTYVLAYTPLKLCTPLCTLIGALVGAIPPMMGWTAVRGSLDVGAWVLAAILFVWQVPHFLALAWLYRDDYERGGFTMLPHVDAHGRLTSQVAVLYSLALLPVGLAVTLVGIAGGFYAIGSLLLGMAMVACAVQLARFRTDRCARRLFRMSLIYLPLLLMLMVADRGSLLTQTIVLAQPTPTADMTPS